MMSPLQRMPDLRHLTFEEFSRFVSNLRQSWPEEYGDFLDEIERLKYGRSIELERVRVIFDQLFAKPVTKGKPRFTLFNTWPFSVFNRKKRKRLEADYYDELDEETFSRRLRRLYDAGAAEAIGFLFNRADRHTREVFASMFLSDEDAAYYSSVDILVRENNDPTMVRGNLGHYVIYTKKGKRDPMLLKFTHQPSTVYYLMHLIDHYNDGTKAERLDLRKNEASFKQLYQAVYDISDNEFVTRFRNLLVRQDRHGELRAGRLNEVTYDIGKRIAEHFRMYDENPNPYIVNANHHLLMPRGSIYFEGDAQTLLKMKFN